MLTRSLSSTKSFVDKIRNRSYIATEESFTRTSVLVILIILLLVLAAVAYAGQAISGAWTAEVYVDDIQMNLVRAGDSRRNFSNMMGMTISVASLGSITATTLSSPAADVNFVVDRAAGTLAFEGHFAGGTGAGLFTFAPKESFVRDMEVLGYRGFRDQDLLLFAMTDLSPAMVRDLRDLGYTPSRRELDDIAIFRITPAYVREMAGLGFTKLAMRDLTDLRISNVSAKSVAEYRAVGYGDLSLRDLKDFGLHHVTPKFINELQSLGYNKLPARELIEMRIFDVTPEFIRRLAEKGYRGIPTRKLIAIKMAGAEEIFTSH